MKTLIISSASLCTAAALAGCAAAASPPAESRPAATLPSTGTAFAFTVTGVRPVPSNGSQDTHAQTPESGCDSATFSADKALGVKVANGFALANFPVAAGLLRHFLMGTGTEVGYRAGSPISQQAMASSAFRAVNSAVQQEILSQLKAGTGQLGVSC